MGIIKVLIINVISKWSYREILATREAGSSLLSVDHTFPEKRDNLIYIES